MSAFPIPSRSRSVERFHIGRRLPGFGVLIAGWLCKPALLLCLGLIISLLGTVLFMRDRALPKGRCGSFETGRMSRRATARADAALTGLI